MNPEANLAALGLTLPNPPAAAGSYVPTVRTGNLLYCAGTICMVGGQMTHTGQVGKEQTVQTANKSAEICALNALANIKAAVGSLDKVARIVFVSGFVNAVDVRGPNYDAVQALVVVTHGGKPVTVLEPQKRHFRIQQTDNSKAAISVGWSRDLFVAMGNPLGNGAWSMRIQYKPLVRYIWLGALVMALGGLTAATDRRYRIRVKAESSAAAAPPGPEPSYRSA